MKLIKLFCCCFLLFACVIAHAEETDTAFNSLYQRYFKCFEQGDEKLFYEASEQLQEYYLKKKNYNSYYKIRLNEIIFDTENEQIYRAIKKSNVMLEDMKKHDVTQYHIVYNALGIIYESRGNYRMAKYYFESALKNIEPNDSNSLMATYSQLASLNLTRNPEEAWMWNEKFAPYTKNFPQYYRVYLALKSGLCFYQEDQENFLKTYEEYKSFVKQHPELDNYGKSTIEMVHAYFDKDYEKALQIINDDKLDFDAIKKSDLRTRIYLRMGRIDDVVKESTYRRELRDSLNSNMFFDNLNQISAELDIAKINEKAAKEREIWLIVVIVLLVVIIIVGAAWNYHRRQTNKRLAQKNKELEMALDRAEESDRMKTNFVHQISHEIRTPLNVITGFAQILTRSEFELSKEQRSEIMQTINKNTNEITNMVNELLEVAQDESRNYYEKIDDIQCAALFNDIQKKVNRTRPEQVELRFINDVPDDFVFKGNQDAMEKIILQLIDNGLKFTEKGFVELHATLQTNQQQQVVTFTVTDTGSGIPKKFHSRIFHRFFKVDNFKQGMGLGLTMSKRMADLLNAQLYIDSSYNKGCRMVFALPL